MQSILQVKEFDYGNYHNLHSALLESMYVPITNEDTRKETLYEAKRQILYQFYCADIGNQPKVQEFNRQRAEFQQAAMEGFDGGIADEGEGVEIED